MSATNTSRSERIEKLIEAYRNARDEQRTATESAMVTTSGAGDRMQAIADELEKLGVDPAKIEGEGADTL